MSTTHDIIIKRLKAQNMQ